MKQLDGEFYLSEKMECEILKNIFKAGWKISSSYNKSSSNNLQIILMTILWFMMSNLGVWKENPSHPQMTHLFFPCAGHLFSKAA